MSPAIDELTFEEVMGDHANKCDSYWIENNIQCPWPASKRPITKCDSCGAKIVVWRCELCIEQIIAGEVVCRVCPIGFIQLITST